MSDHGWDMALVGRIATVTARAANLEQLSRPFLELLQDLTGFESTYVTVLHWDDFKQEVRYARNTGILNVTEGVFVDWSDTLCRRALLEGRLATDDVPSVWPDSDAAREMGIVTYVSVPIVTSEGATYGTLCAASARSVQLPEDDRRIMELFARLLGGQAERERQAGQERDRVATAALHVQANAAAIAATEHKLKTPLTVIRSAVGQLAQGADLDDSERHLLLEALERQSTTLEACVHDLLTQSQPSSPIPPMELGVVPLEPFLVRIASDMRLVAPARAITLTCDDRLACIANTTALMHVLEHLLDNAIKYTDEGSPIQIAALEDHGAAAITVSDEGPGLVDDAMFQAFTRGALSSVDGSGMGLFVVRSLVAGMGGTVEALPSPRGTTMRIRLPLEA
ncbi:MAG: ATP-binding protein [Acidimicrobiales bacterium]